MNVFIIQIIIASLIVEKCSTQTDLTDLPRTVLAVHNHYRLKFSLLPALRLKSSLNKLSQDWARTLAIKRKVYSRPGTPYGENHFRSTILNTDIVAEYIRVWFNELQYFNETIPSLSLRKMKNVTQMLWKSTKYMGVGLATNGFRETYFVCNYEPKGNIDKEMFANFIKPVIYERPDLLSGSKLYFKKFNFVLIVGLVIIFCYWRNFIVFY